jgi:DNA replication and repair protein RecF
VTETGVIGAGALGAPSPSAVLRLTLTRFRNYASLRLSLDDRPVVLAGPNGAGKTNLLEAVSLLAPGRGLRNARLADVQQLGATEGGWATAARLQTPHGPVEIGVGVEAPPQPGERERRLTRIDGEPARSQTALAQHIAVVWLTPQMDRLFLDSAGTRRRFIDRLAFGFDPAHAGRLSRYEHAMRERSHVLRDRLNAPDWLAALESRMAADGAAVAAARRDAAARLTLAASRGVGPFPGAILTMEGWIDERIAAGPALEAEDEMRAELARTRNHDGAAVGPHRSDLAVRHIAKDMPAALCSTGEQKALLIAVTLANTRLLTAERGAPPLLLLDEVAAHLDRDRREALFAEVTALGAQAWMTGVDLETFAPLGAAAQRFTVTDGSVVGQEPA